MEFSREDELRLRQHITQLSSWRSAVRLTVLEMESVHLDPFYCDFVPNPEAQRLDLENAVLMQELMAMKELKTELKSQCFLLEKERSILQLELSKKDNEYLTQIAQLKDELERHQCHLATVSDITTKQKDASDDNALHTADTDVLSRETRLKVRIQELMKTLERLSKSSEMRHQQSAGFVNDLKKANSALVCAFEKAKKKYVNRIKKMEQQTDVHQQQYESQVTSLKQRISTLEDQLLRFQQQHNVLPQTY